MQGRHERLCGLYFLKDDDINRAEIEHGVPLTQVSINVNIVDTLARVEIKQVYTSDKQSVSPAGVCLPLIEFGASSFSVLFLVNGKEATPRPFDKFKYSQSRTNGAPNELFIAKLFFALLPDIPPGKTVEIKLCYLVSMEFVAGAYHLTIPSCAVNVLENDAKKRKKISKSFNATVILALAAEAMSQITNIGVSGEKVEMTRPSATKAVVHCKRTVPVNDLCISVTVSDPKSCASWFLPAEKADGVSVCLVATTPNKLNLRPFKAEIILMIDNSVSLKESGLLSTLKKLAIQLIKKAPSDVLFNVVSFGGDLSELCFAGSMEKSKKPIAKATKFINGLKGSAVESDFAAALETLQDVATPEGHSRQIILLSDFLMNVSAGHLEFITELAKGKWARFFCVGVGQASYRGASRIAVCGRGLHTICEANESKLCLARIDRILSGVMQPPTSMVSVKHKDSSIGMLSDATAVDAAFEGTRMHRFLVLPSGSQVPEGSVDFFFGEGSCKVNLASIFKHDAQDSVILRSLYAFYSLELLLRGDAPRKDWSARRVTTSREFGIVSKYNNIILSVEQEKQKALDAKKPRAVPFGSKKGFRRPPPKKSGGVPQRALPPGIDSPPGTWPLPMPAAPGSQMTHAERQAIWIQARKTDYAKEKASGTTDSTIRYNEMEGVFLEVGLKHLASLLQVPADQIDSKRIVDFRRVIDLEIKKLRQESFGAPAPTIERNDLIERIQKSVSELVDVAGHNLLKGMSVTGDALNQRRSEAENPLMVSAFSSRGGRDYQEDRFVVLPNFNNLMGIRSLENSFFCGVYDGHDGFQASEYCKTHLHVGFKRHLFIHKGAVEEALSDAFVQADVDFNEIATGKNWSSGATATVVVIDGNVLYQANVGDGEAFMKARGEIVVLTEKHNPGQPAEIERLKSVNAPLLDMRNGKFRVGGQDGMLAVSRSIGDPKYSSEHVISVPFVKRVELIDAEFVVLASDGLWDVLTFEEVSKMVATMTSTEQMKTAAEVLVKEALDRKSQDNITCVVLFFKKFIE